MHQERTDEQLVVAIAHGPGALAEFYRRHVGRITGMGVRRFADPQDVADFAAEVFVEVMGAARGFDPRRGKAVPWLYGLAGNVAAELHRHRFRRHDAENRLAGRLSLDADDYARVEEHIDAAKIPTCATSSTAAPSRAAIRGLAAMIRISRSREVRVGLVAMAACSRRG